ncbi:MAG: DUF819 family protein [Bacteroidales bacterium]
MTKFVLILSIYIFGPILLILLYRKVRICKMVGTIIMAYALGIIMSLSGLMNFSVESSSEIPQMQEILQAICVPLAIPLMLFSSDFKLWLKSLKKTFLALITGVFSVCVVVFAAYWLFRDGGIEELPKAAGLMVGFYTGGTPNVASLKLALHPGAETFMLVNSFEIMITFFFLAFLVGGGYKLVRKILVYKKEETLLEPISNSVLDPKEGLQQERERDEKKIDVNSFEDYEGFFKRENLKKLLFPFGCSILLFIVAGIGSLFVSKDYRVVSIILTITTLAIGLSFVDKIRNTPKTFELGMYFILVFSIIIASEFRIDQINTNTYNLFFFIVVIMLGSIGLHLLLAKIFKVDADLFTIASVALIFSPPFVPTIASLMNSRRCLISGLVIGLCGYAVGNYLGVGMYALTSLFGN